MIVYDSIGGREGVVVADHLAEHGCAVTFVTTLPQPSSGLLPTRDWGKFYGRLRRKGVSFVVDTELLRIASDSARLRDVFTGQEREQPVEAIVLVLGSQAEDGLFHALKRQARPDQLVQMVGDCVAPRRVFDAVREAELAARAIH